MIARPPNLLVQTAIGRWVAQPVENRVLVTLCTISGWW